MQSVREGNGEVRRGWRGGGEEEVGEEDERGEGEEDDWSSDVVPAALGSWRRFPCWQVDSRGHRGRPEEGGGGGEGGGGVP